MPDDKTIGDDEVETFDKLIETAIDNDCISDFMESYLRFRDSGIDFVKAVAGAQEELDLELSEEPEDQKTGNK